MDEYPKGAGMQQPGDMVQVLMQESLARHFEERVLKPTGWKLAGPLLFGPDDVPTYILEVPK